VASSVDSFTMSDQKHLLVCITRQNFNTDQYPYTLSTIFYPLRFSRMHLMFNVVVSTTQIKQIFCSKQQHFSCNLIQHLNAKINTLISYKWNYRWILHTELRCTCMHCSIWQSNLAFMHKTLEVPLHVCHFYTYS